MDDVRRCIICNLPTTTPKSNLCVQHRYTGRRQQSPIHFAPWRDPTEQQIDAYLSNRDRSTTDPDERKRAVVELAELDARTRKAS